MVCRTLDRSIGSDDCGEVSRLGTADRIVNPSTMVRRVLEVLYCCSFHAVAVAAY